MSTEMKSPLCVDCLAHFYDCVEYDHYCMRNTKLERSLVTGEEDVVGDAKLCKEERAVGPSQLRCGEEGRHFQEKK